VKILICVASFFLSLSSFSASAQSSSLDNIGGIMDKCYQGKFITGLICIDKTVAATTSSYSASVNVRASYLTSDGNSVQVVVNFTLNDPNGYFKSFQNVPISGWASVAGFHREWDWHNVNFNIPLTRTGSNQYQGSFSFQTTNAFGAEYVEYTKWITFSPYGSNEKLVFDLSK